MESDASPLPSRLTTTAFLQNYCTGVHFTYIPTLFRMVSEMQWIAPQSRFLLKTLFKRNYDHLSADAQKAINWSVLGVDVVALYALLTFL